MGLKYPHLFTSFPKRAFGPLGGPFLYLYARVGKAHPAPRFCFAKRSYGA